MDLDERKKQILGAIIESYIQSPEPLGSRTIAKLSDLNLSSATIRNEMADLEDMGLLEQPHTSAGRIPSHLGYRVYVDRLMKKYSLTNQEINKMRSLLEIKVNEMDTLVKQIASIYSKMTNYTVVGISQMRERGFVKYFKLLPINENTFLLIVVDNNNLVNDKKITFEKAIDEAQLQKINDLLNEQLTGLTTDQIALGKILDLQQSLPGSEEILMPVLRFVNECIEQLDSPDVFIGGATNLFNFPEYANVERAKELLDFFDRKSNLYKMAALTEGEDVRVVIGKENDAIELKNCSVVLSSYKVDGENVGAIGLIGPTRMDYSKAMSHLEFFTNSMDEDKSDKKRGEQNG